VEEEEEGRARQKGMLKHLFKLDIALAKEATP
jgi:hypothetical protein